MSTQVQVAASLNPQASATGIMEAPMVEIEHVSLWYGEKLALKDISMSIPKHRVTAYIGPSGCGKTTLLRCLNRMNDLVDGVRMAGNIRIGGTDIHDPTLDVTELRKRVGMVFQKSNPFPRSIFENVAYGPRILGTGGRTDLEAIVERSLRGAALWDEVSDRLNESALGLKNSYTIVIVTHNMQQAARVSDYTGFMLLGELVEVGVTRGLFTNPRDKRTEDYITGRFG